MPTSDDLLQEDELSDELSHERTPEELAHWVDEKFSKFSASEDTKRRARLREGLAKQFVEEVQPLRADPNRLW